MEKTVGRKEGLKSDWVSTSTLKIVRQMQAEQAHENALFHHEVAAASAKADLNAACLFSMAKLSLATQGAVISDSGHVTSTAAITDPTMNKLMGDFESALTNTAAADARDAALSGEPEIPVAMKPTSAVDLF
ncbi:hypothetical protein IAR50_004983 [Cryptococcus sp. DSM 104548]